MSTKKPAIIVKNISKTFTINHKNKASYATLKDDFGNIFKRAVGKDVDTSEEHFKALNDISFEVPEGEIFGIVGKNGSGKSTLLKILSRIIEPDKGSIEIHGKVASLLEVGTGFHPELTGRENIFFNGSMLGMKKSEIEAKFNDIVDFSEVERFIDTPVKFYSSGMYVRLAFSVAAHLDPDVLILDEVLAVGDAAFQKKSMNKILSTMRSGKTVLFVSHSTTVLETLCTSGILLENGNVKKIGKINQVIKTYNGQINKSIISYIKPKWTWAMNGDDYTQMVSDYTEENSDTGRKLSPELVLKSIKIVDAEGNVIERSTKNNLPKWAEFEIDIRKNDPLLNIGMGVRNENETFLFQSHHKDSAEDKWLDLKPGVNIVRVKIPERFLNGGKYTLSFLASLHNIRWIYEPNSNPPSVEFIIEGGYSDSSTYINAREGLLAPILDWSSK